MRTIHLRPAADDSADRDAESEQVLVVVEGEQPAGRLQLRYRSDAIEIVKIYLRPGLRGRGVGTRLVRGVMCRAASEGTAVAVSVSREHPRAAAWCRRLGFTEVGRDADRRYLRWSDVADSWQARGARFDDEQVAADYVLRPDYPPEVFDCLLSLMPERIRALDLGCGPGKLARGLAPYVASVVAVDPSPSMIRVGRSLPGGDAPTWLESRAEDLENLPPFDLVVAGASVHWMQHPVVFGRLRLGDGAYFVTVEGDVPKNPPWATEMVARLRHWIPTLDGVDYDPVAHRARMDRHESWLTLEGSTSFLHEVVQSVDDHVRSHHARSTFTLRAMGAERAAAFDHQLREVLVPFALHDVRLHFEVETRVRWYRLPPSIPQTVS